MQAATPLPPPVPCLTAAAEPETTEAPTLPPLVVAPSESAPHTNEWWRALALHFESRARRAELAQAFAFGTAEHEREARIANGQNLEACGAELRARDQGSAPVG